MGRQSKQNNNSALALSSSSKTILISAVVMMSCIFYFWFSVPTIVLTNSKHGKKNDKNSENLIAKDFKFDGCVSKNSNWVYLLDLILTNSTPPHKKIKYFILENRSQTELKPLVSFLYWTKQIYKNEVQYKINILFLQAFPSTRFSH